MRHAAIILREEAIMLLCNQSDARTHPALGLRNPSILSRVATRRLGLLRKGSSRLAVPKQEGREHTSLGSNSQEWRARRHLNSVVGKRSVYLESVFAPPHVSIAMQDAPTGVKSHGQARARLDGKSDFAACRE